MLSLPQSVSFSVNLVNQAPVQIAAIPDASFHIGKPFSLAVTKDQYFRDADGHPIQFQINAVGTPCAFITTVPDTLTFLGAPSLPSHVVSCSYEILFTDQYLLTPAKSNQFTITIANAPPVLAAPVPPIELRFNQTVSGYLPSIHFADPDGDPVSFTQVNIKVSGVFVPLSSLGSPYWLRLDLGTLQYQADTNLIADVAQTTYDLEIHFTDGFVSAAPLPASVQFLIVNHSPELRQPMPTQYVHKGQRFAIKVPLDYFSDPDKDKVIISEVKLYDPGTLVESDLSSNPLVQFDDVESLITG